MNILWLDTETGGLIPGRNPVLTLACLMEVNGKVQQELYLKLKPLPGQVLEDKALEVNGITRQEIERDHGDPMAALLELRNCVRRHTGGLRVLPAGHNVNFDLDHLRELSKRVDVPLPFEYHKLDTMALGLLLQRCGHISVPNVKLGTLADYYGISLAAHNALEDVKATRQVFLEITKRLTYSRTPNEQSAPAIEESKGPTTETL